MSNEEYENPYDTQKRSFGKLFDFIIKFSIIIAFVAAFSFIFYAIAHAHYDDGQLYHNGHKFWMADPYYQQKDHEWGCCGVNDCKPAEEVGATIVETNDGFLVTDPRANYDENHQKFFSKKNDYVPRSLGKKGKGLYFTEDPENRAYVCVYGGHIECLAVPRRMMR